MTTGYIAPQAAVNEKTSQQAFTYHNGRWAIQCNDDLYLEMPVATFGVQEGWGDGSTQNAVKEAATGWNNKINEIGYDVTNDIWQVFSRSVAAGGIRYHTTPYTPGSDTYGTTTVTRIDNGGDNWNSSGFDSGQCAFITDQQGNPLFFALGSSGDGGTLSPKDGMLVGYDPLGVGQPHAQIESGFNRSAATNADPFLFNDGSSDYVGVVYSNGTNFQLAYHTTEATISNYSTGWIVESAGSPGGDTVDDHVCARAFDGSLYAVVKGGNAARGYLLTTTGGIDTATNNTTFLFTEIQDNCSRPVICINESAEEMHIAYEFGGSISTINLKSQPLSGFSFTPSNAGTVFIENGVNDMENPTPPAHNVTSDMEFLPFLCENNTLNSTWHNRIDISAAPAIAPDDIDSDQTISNVTLSVGGVAIPVNDIESVQTLSESTLTQQHIFAVDNISTSQTISTATFTQQNNLSVNGLLSIQTISNVSLTVAGALGVNDVDSLQTITEPTLTQAHILSVNNIETGQTLSNVLLSVAGALEVQGLTQEQVISNIALVQNHLLSVDNLSQVQTLSNVTLAIEGVLSVDSILSEQTVSNSSLITQVALLTDNITNQQFISVVSFDEGQDIGTVTVAFKEDDISVKYGLLNITVQFKE